MNPPPDNEERWILKELNTTKESVSLPKGHEDLAGTEIDQDSMQRLSSMGHTTFGIGKQ